MKETTLNIKFTEYDHINELNVNDAQLIQSAEENLKNAYAPYSLFKVSSAIQLNNAKMVLGTNQENAAYPSGLCAERVAIFSAKSTYPTANVETVVIVTAQGNSTPFSPCGGCRQVLIEYELTQKKPIRVILKSGNSKIWIFNSVKDLLPFAFDADDILKKE